MGLKPDQQKLVIRVGWVAFVSIHIAWVCGWLAFLGLASPFASAADVERVLEVQRVVARVQITSEIEQQVRFMCSLPPEQRNPIRSTIERLRDDLFRTTGERGPEPTCKD